METRAHYVFIGAIVLIAVAGAFLFVLWLGQAQREFDEYDVVFTERVSGLSVGALVRFNGIQKGEVQSLSIPEDDPSVVVARVRVDKDTPVKTDTKAELELVGFTGLAIIQFVGGSPSADLLKNTVNGVPRLEADSSGFAAFLESSGDIVAAANRLLSDENTMAISNFLANLETVSGAVASQDENISKTIENTAKITEDIAAVSDELAEIAKNLDAILANDAPDTIRDARETIANANALVSDLRAVVEENRDSIAIFTDQGLAQVGPAVAEARRLFKTLDQVLREIDRDPRGYLLNESTPEYEAQTQ